jgi:hypothetical protein
MASNDLVLCDQTFSVGRTNLLMKCHKFLDRPNLLNAPYKVQSAVTAASFEHFVDVIEGSRPHVTASNASDLSLLCDEFGFVELGQQVSEFDPRLGAVQEAKHALPEGIQQLLDEMEGHVHVLEKRRNELVLMMARAFGGGPKGAM